MTLALIIVLRILFEFHEIQNKKAPKSVYATYLVHGLKPKIVRDGDVEMGNIAPPTNLESSSEPCQTSVLALVEENNLQSK